MTPLEKLDRPIAFHRSFVPFAGITGALLLSQFIYWQNRTTSPDGFFYKSARECEEETGLTTREQETARRRLRDIGILEETKRGIPCTCHFRINEQVLQSSLNSSDGVKKRMSVSTNSENKFQQIVETNSETTSETTVIKEKYEKESLDTVKIGNDPFAKLGDVLKQKENITVSKNKQKVVTGKSPFVKPVDPDDITFEEFWKMYGSYPRKQDCLKLFSKMSTENRKLIKKHLPEYIRIKTNPDGTPSQYRLRPYNYLSREGWFEPLREQQLTKFDIHRMTLNTNIDPTKYDHLMVPINIE